MVAGDKKEEEISPKVFLFWSALKKHLLYTRLGILFHLAAAASVNRRHLHPAIMSWRRKARDLALCFSALVAVASSAELISGRQSVEIEADADFAKLLLQLESAPKRDVPFSVLLLPGLTVSQIDARLDKPSVVRPYCAKRSDWFTLWIKPVLLAPGLQDCWLDNYRLVVDQRTGRTRNPPGVETRIPGFGDVSKVENRTSLDSSMGEFTLLSSLLSHMLLCGSWLLPQADSCSCQAGIQEERDDPRCSLRLSTRA